MATTKIWAVKKDLKSAIDYIENPEKTITLKSVIDYAKNQEKTIMLRLCTGINCNVETAYEEMRRIKLQFGKADGILAHHAEQSFVPGEITAEKAHEIGVHFAEDMWGDRFQVLVATHIDKAHIHNHFVLNSVSFVNGKKYNGCKATYRKIRELSDKLCRENGLSIVDLPKDEAVKMAGVYARKKGYFNLREYIKHDIDIAISQSITMEEFYKNLRSMGYSIKFGKYMGVSPQGKDGYIRLRSIKDEDYLPEGIRRRVAENYARNYGIPVTLNKNKVFRCKQPYKKLSGYQALYYKYLFLLGKIPNKRYPKRIPYSIAKEVKNLNKISQEVRFIGKYNLQNSDDLRKTETELTLEFESLNKQRDELRKAIRRVSPEETKLETRNQIKELTEKIGILRGELKLCEGIRYRSGICVGKQIIREKIVNEERGKNSELRERYR